MQTPVRDLTRSEPMSGLASVSGPHLVGAAPDVQRVDLAVIVPAFNEIAGIEGTLARVHEVLAGFEGTSEVIVVDDGSEDGTAHAAAACGARVARSDAPKGLPRGYVLVRRRHRSDHEIVQTGTRPQSWQPQVHTD
jgi:hypothetical protein